MDIFPAYNTKSVHLITIIIYILVCILHHCSSYPTGAPLVACQEMRPYHPPTTTSGTPPFAIDLTETVYKPGSEIKGKIYSPKGVLFRGFLIQARKADNSEMTPFGDFIVSGTDTHTNCGNANKQGLTHTSNSNKTEIDFTWKAPMTFQGDLHFKLTIVESYNVSRFWLGIYSSVVKDCSLHPSSECADIPTEPPATISPGPETTSDETISTPASTSPAIPLTSTAPKNNIPNDPECGVSKGCFPDCSNGCEYLVTWQVDSNSMDNNNNAVDTDGVHFEFKMVLEETDNVWIAIGLSPTGKMDGTNVIACLTGGNNVSVESSHNEGYTNVMYSDKTLGLSAMSGSVQGNLIECSFTRKIVTNVTDFLNLKNEVYLLVGHGPVVKGIKQQHTQIPVSSPGKVNFLSSSANITTEQPLTINPAPRNNIPNDPECGVSKGCFPDCSNGCEYLVTWQTNFESKDRHAAADDDSNSEWVHFELKMVLEETDNVWIAVGLSPTGMMDGTNVIACLTGRNNVSVESSHNVGYKNVMYSTKTFGLLAMSGSVQGNLIECSLTRHIAMNVSDFLNLKNEVYLLVGHGPVVKGIKQQHTKIPVRSPGKVNFLSSSVNVTTELPFTTRPAPQNNIPNDPECGVSKGCFPDCSNGCEYLVTWQVDLNSMDNTNNAATDANGVHFEFKMVLEETDNVWIAIGFSPTGKMDDTNVIACLTGSNNVSVESSHNEGYTNVMYNKKTLGLSNMQGSVKGKKIECSFTRKMSMNVTDFMNLKDEAYLIVGHGPVVNGIKQQHTTVPVRSSGKVDFLSHKVSKESDSATPLIKLHGSLMVLAWVLCSSIGVVIARHFKSMAHGKMMCNVRYWFAIHRTLMFVVVLCVVVAFVAIFYEIGGFSNISADPGKEYTKAHPYLGIIVTCLTLLNPIMALFRPPVDHQHRPIFNWAHFSVGTVAHIIAVVTIYFGINLSNAKVDEYAKNVMIAYSVIFVVVQSVLEIQRKRDAPKDSIIYGKLNSNSEKQRLLTTTSNSLTTYKTASHGDLEDKKDGVSMFSTLVLFLHGVCMVVAATLLILMICDPTHFHPKK